ncbi:MULTISPECIES: peptide ABC transporter substrate-binding protein [unclassified Streptomyces]|uniref:peptide ABC transporter substrate-binding protein n=1 Tax=unclassified Streptomyces TaxID=2593676 RepID=UPI002E13399A|nr:ABC transporter substrate-binding protein [Streptomyces sp. NBC_01207]WTA18790.1 ABC transporter substrate-binding protein [Streptomyces sp. NBC_00853]
MRGAKSAKWVVGAVVVALAATACGGGDGDKDKGSADGGVFRLGSTEPDTIDPGRAHESTGVLLANALFTGLYGNTPDGLAEPALAESATSDDSCTSWTFKIKPDTKFSNGEAVDAESFARGWARAAHKAAASDVAYHFSGIKGYAELQDGSAKAFSGVTTPDPTTIKVDLSKADCEFVLKTAHNVYSPVPKVAKVGEEDKAFGEAPIGNGPFKMDGTWEHNKAINLVRNDTYGLEKASLGKVKVTLLNDKTAQQLEYDGFQAGTFDYAHIPTPMLKTAEAKYKPQNKWFVKDTSGMEFVLPIGDNGPTNNKDARLAISYAIDRQAIAKGVFQGFKTPSTTIVPPAFPKSYQKDLCVSCIKQDVAKAKEYAEKGGLKPGSEVKFSFNTGAGHEEWVQAVAKQIEDVLGVKVKLDGKDFPGMLKEQQSAAGSGLYRFAWGADYPTPENFLFPLLHSTSMSKDAEGNVTGDNRARYNNPEFDKLIDTARATKDEAARIAMYKQAEKMAMEDMALIPTFNRSQQRLMATDKFNGLDDINFNEDPILEKISLKK